MRLRNLVILLVVAIVVAVMTSPGLATPTPARVDADPISGEWNGSFQVEGYSADFTFKFKLDGKKVIGTGESAHTGPGTLSNGSWADGKLSFTMDFAAHESIAVTGSLNDGKLAGEFHTEGMTGKWEAKRK